MTSIAERPTTHPRVEASTKQPATGRPVPDIRTPLPGPKARQHVAFDHRYTSPSLPRAYPLVPVRGRGRDRRGHRRQPLPRLHRRHRRLARPATTIRASRPRSSARRTSCSTSARRTSTCPSTPSWPPSWTASRRCRVPRAPSSATPARRPSRPPSSSPASPRAGSTSSPSSAASTAARTASVSLTASKCQVPRGLRADAAGRVPRAVRPAPVSTSSRTASSRRLVPADEVAAIFVEPIQGEGGYVIPDDDFLPAPARAVRRPRHPAGRRRGPVGRRPHRQDVGGRALGRRARHPADAPRASPAACRWAR